MAEPGGLVESEIRGVVAEQVPKKLWRPSEGGCPTAEGRHSYFHQGCRLGTDLELKSSGPNENTPHR